MADSTLVTSWGALVVTTKTRNDELWGALSRRDGPCSSHGHIRTAALSAVETVWQILGLSSMIAPGSADSGN
jgi:hypothetical protein